MGLFYFFNFGSLSTCHRGEHGTYNCHGRDGRSCAREGVRGYGISHHDPSGGQDPRAHHERHRGADRREGTYPEREVSGTVVVTSPSIIGW